VKNRAFQALGKMELVNSDIEDFIEATTIEGTVKTTTLHTLTLMYHINVQRTQISFTSMTGCTTYSPYLMVIFIGAGHFIKTIRRNRNQTLNSRF